jgi:hypothetical protein
MLDKWAHLGHTLGECWVDAVKGITYIHIPKNASSFVKGCLLGSLKFTHSPSLIKNDRYLITLRDPINRWTSGMAEYEFNSKQANIPYKEITFDDHTETQCYFLDGVDLAKCDFIRVDNNLKNNLKHWLVEQGYNVNTDTAIKFNVSQGTEKEILKIKYQTIIDNDLEFMLELKEHFAKDYELINRVKFYGN